MSGWDSYIDNLILQCRDASGDSHCDKACIIGIDGGAKWTSDSHANALKLTPAESAAIAACFKSKNFSGFQASGVVVETEKYQFLREEDGKLVLAKKKGSGGLTLQASKTAIVIAHCPEGKQQGNVNKGTGAVADYLEQQSM
jgi:profilin